MSNPASTWQQTFIAKNLTAIAYNAWTGYLTSNRGVVICSTNNPRISVTGESFLCHFVPRPRLAAFLNAWLASPDTLILQNHFINAHIIEAVEQYNPETAAIFLLESGQQVTFFNLKNLPIAPPDAYQQVVREWQEFPPSSFPLIQIS